MMLPPDTITLDARNGSWIQVVLRDGRLEVLAAMCVGDDGFTWQENEVEYGPTGTSNWTLLIDHETGRQFFLAPEGAA